MRIISKKIKGSGRGKLLGWPTINLQIPKELNLSNGVYAVNVLIKKTMYQGALHYGPVPTFNQLKQSLEVYLLKTTNKDLTLLEDEKIRVKVIKKIREVIKFKNEQDLKNQISQDIKKVEKVLKEINN